MTTCSPVEADLGSRVEAGGSYRAERVSRRLRYVERYHDRPHSGLGYRTPSEVRQTWDDAQEALHKQAA